ncbi:nodulation S family protein [Streptomyces sp. NBC_01754]|uniref:SAM-dependent methyltransferase n=1 Tax=Streptomyces sp. NBC_01754 TaxID=2975930 RepID=UPI002DDA99DF|nr:SAM-dependent methyltransferase [Streptomyces sp. NBC_01754]WSC95977.1 nodulation S family protein [Streptomyces sp. NBC_01754]
MIDIVVVLRAEDAVLDFLSVLTPPLPGAATAPGEDNATHVLLADFGDHLVLPPGVPLPERLGMLAARVREADEDAASPGPDVLGAQLARISGGRGVCVWTHSPADNRRSRGRLGHDVAEALDTAETGGGTVVRHAVGYSPFLQFVSELDRPLDRELVAAKLDFVNRHARDLLDSDSPQHMVYTARVPAAERYFTAGPDERRRLFALLASLDDEAASVPDPWEFTTSPYETERLDATTAWITRFRDPDAGPLIEVGACEGALTARLAGKGHRVEATEPNPDFRARLAEGPGAEETVRVHSDGLETLAGTRRLAGAAYLLIEMLYYGQDLDLLTALPTGLVFVALEPEVLDATLRPWLATAPDWEQMDETVLVRPALETVCGGRAHLRKRGSTGVLLRRRPTLDRRPASS